MLGRFFFGTETLTTLSLTIGLGGLNEYFSFASLAAAPARLLALFLVRERLLFRGVKLPTLSLTFFQRGWKNFSIETAPAFWRAFLLVCLCFLLGGVALTAFVLAIRPSALENLSIKAAPPACLAISNSVLFGPKALTTFLAAILSVGAENLSVHTAPVTRLTIPDRFFGARVTLPTSRLAIGSRANVNYTIDTAVAPLGQKAFVMATAAVRTWQRPPGAMRRIRRTSRVTSGTTVPRVRVATRVPLPSIALLLPNPLTASIAPLAAINRGGYHQERMLLAIERYAFTNNLQAVVDSLGNSQHFEIAGR